MTLQSLPLREQHCDGFVSQIVTESLKMLYVFKFCTPGRQHHDVCWSRLPPLTTMMYQQVRCVLQT